MPPGSFEESGVFCAGYCFLPFFWPPVTLLTRSSLPAGFLAERAEDLAAEGFGSVEGWSRRLPCTDCLTEATAARLPLGWAVLAGFFVCFARRGVDARLESGAGSLVLPVFWRRFEAVVAAGWVVVAWAPF